MPRKGRDGPRHWLDWLPAIPSHAVHLVQAIARRRTAATRTTTSSTDAHEWLRRDACVDVDAIFGRIEEKSEESDRPDVHRPRNPA